jgi:hypothetical protein
MSPIIFCTGRVNFPTSHKMISSKLLLTCHIQTFSQPRYTAKQNIGFILHVAKLDTPCDFPQQMLLLQTRSVALKSHRLQSALLFLLTYRITRVSQQSFRSHSPIFCPLFAPRDSRTNIWTDVVYHPSIFNTPLHFRHASECVPPPLCTQCVHILHMIHNVFHTLLSCRTI